MDDTDVDTVYQYALDYVEKIPYKTRERGPAGTESSSGVKP